MTGVVLIRFSVVLCGEGWQNVGVHDENGNANEIVSVLSDGAVEICHGDRGCRPLAIRMPQTFRYGVKELYSANPSWVRKSHY